MFWAALLANAIGNVVCAAELLKVNPTKMVNEAGASGGGADGDGATGGGDMGRGGGGATGGDATVTQHGDVPHVPSITSSGV